MKIRNLVRIFAIIAILGVALVFFAVHESEDAVDESWSQIDEIVENIKERFIQKNKLPQSIDLGEAEEPKEEPVQTLEIAEVTETSPPFTSQSPFAEWDDPTQQDACEESSSLMAVYWARDLKLTPKLAKEKILDIAAYEVDNFGFSTDTSAADTLERLIFGYFEYNNARLIKDAVLEDLIAEIAKNRVLLVPADGRALKNPYFTLPGPEYHMLLVYDYDEITGEFITNDPGTRRGEAFRYDKDILFNAIRDYPTGEHKKVLNINKNIISISR